MSRRSGAASAREPRVRLGDPVAVLLALRVRPVGVDARQELPGAQLRRVLELAGRQQRVELADVDHDVLERNRLAGRHEVRGRRAERAA